MLLRIALHCCYNTTPLELAGVSSKESTKTLEGGRTAVERMTTFFNNLYEMAYVVIMRMMRRRRKKIDYEMILIINHSAAATPKKITTATKIIRVIP